MKQNIATVVLISIAVLVLIVAVANSFLQKRRTEKAHSQHVAQLRQNLLAKALGDEFMVHRLIWFERQQSGDIPEDEAMQAAIDRWEHDNR
jgi:hypothetical protein